MFNWPGNIAQLVNYVEKTVILNQSVTKDLILDVDSLALDMGDYSNDAISLNNYDLSLKELQKLDAPNKLIKLSLIHI